MKIHNFLSRTQWIPYAMAAMVILAPLPLGAQLLEGSVAPEINAASWLDGIERSVYDNDGKYTLVEFWATWCEPCLETIPHLNRLFSVYGDRVNFISLTDEDRREAGVDSFARRLNMAYPVGSGSTSLFDYNVYLIPKAFIVDPQGIIVWQGHTIDGLDLALDQAARGTLAVTTLEDLPSVPMILGRPWNHSIDNSSPLFAQSLVASAVYRGQAGETIVVTATSTDFDTMLIAYEDSQEVAFNDDWTAEILGQRSLPNRFDSALEYQFSEESILQILVQSYDGKETGTFQLRIESR